MTASAPTEHTHVAPNRRYRTVSAVCYFALAVAGLVGTWTLNLSYTGRNYVGDWFANPASSSAAVDLIVVVVVGATLYFREARRLGWRLWIPLVFIAVSILVAVSFALPLFLGLRELRLHRNPPRSQRDLQGP